jgi:flagellar protein FlaI
MVLGGTAAGKTTALNALACLIRPGSKIITIEETAELNLSHENWISLISRQSYGLGGSTIGEVSLFDLVKATLRHRPDVLVVGEVRGQEAYVLFQALATGHGGMCTMHAENLDSAVKRLTQKPMDISPAYIPLMNVVLSIQRVHITKNNEKKAYRRVMDVNEIADYQDYRCTFKWNSTKDVQLPSFDKSVVLASISEHQGQTKKELLDEIARRQKVLQWMRERNIRSYKDVAGIIAEYSARPKEIYEKVLAGQEVKPIAVPQST